VSRDEIRVVRTARGARLLQDDVVLSELLARPGATHTLFDVLAAAVAALAPGPRIAMLGFAGGGIVAPLRAMGCEHPIEAVDLSLAGEPLFRELSDAWAGAVRLDEADAVAWLRRRRAGFDLVLEDLSAPSPAGVVKPYVTFDPLPALIRDQLRPGGVVVTNLLPLPGTSWDAIEARLAHPHRRAVVIHVEEYENRVLVAGDDLAGASELGRAVRAALRTIGSTMAARLRFRTLRNA